AGSKSARRVTKFEPLQRQYGLPYCRTGSTARVGGTARSERIHKSGTARALYRSNSTLKVAVQPGNFTYYGDKLRQEKSRKKPKGDVVTIPQRLLLLEDDKNDVQLLERRLAQDWPDCQLVTTATEAEYREALAA